jgi:hypothetical protein
MVIPPGVREKHQSRGCHVRIPFAEKPVASKRVRSTFQPRLEALEGRELPTVGLMPAQVSVTNTAVIANQIRLDAGNLKLDVEKAVRPPAMPSASQAFKPGIAIVQSAAEGNKLKDGTQYQFMVFQAGQGFTVQTGQAPHWWERPFQDGEQRQYRRGPDGKTVVWSSVHGYQTPPPPPLATNSPRFW